jgi:hypothetical protein
MRALRRWLNLPRAEKRLFLAALAWVVLFRASLWILPLRFVMGLSRRVSVPRSAPPVEDIIPLIRRAVGRAARYMPRATCLTRSLSIHTMLSRRGIVTQLRIGVVKDPAGNFLAHAWLERDGAKLFPGEEVERYLPFPAIDLISQSKANHHSA